MYLACISFRCFASVGGGGIVSPNSLKFLIHNAWLIVDKASCLIFDICASVNVGSAITPSSSSSSILGLLNGFGVCGDITVLLSVKSTSSQSIVGPLKIVGGPGIVPGSGSCSDIGCLN